MVFQCFKRGGDDYNDAVGLMKGEWKDGNFSYWLRFLVYYWKKTKILIRMEF